MARLTATLLWLDAITVAALLVFWQWDIDATLLALLAHVLWQGPVCFLVARVLARRRWLPGVGLFWLVAGLAAVGCMVASLGEWYGYLPLQMWRIAFFAYMALRTLAALPLLHPAAGDWRLRAAGGLICLGGWFFLATTPHWVQMWYANVFSLDYIGYWGLGVAALGQSLLALVVWRPAPLPRA